MFRLAFYEDSPILKCGCSSRAFHQNRRGVMAQRKRRAAARRGKVATRGKPRKPVKSVLGKAAKRTGAKATSRKRVTKAKPKRAVAKKAVPTIENVIANP